MGRRKLDLAAVDIVEVKDRAADVIQNGPPVQRKGPAVKRKGGDAGEAKPRRVVQRLAMATLEKQRRGDKPTREEAAALEMAKVEPRDLAVEAVAASPWQPRRDFPAEEIRALADSIAAQGQIHPVAVRVAPGHTPAAPRYELVDGERRWRAVKLLGWATVRGEVAEYSDAQVRAIVLATALQRKELNAIEEARAFQAAIAAGDAAGPTELAKQLGLSQGHVSNRLRLLELPEKAQAKVISREISPTHARTLVALKDAPAAIALVVKETAGKDLSGDEFESEIRYALNRECREIEHGKHIYDREDHRSYPNMKLSAEQREQLAIVTHGGSGGHGFPQAEFATNVKLYDKLWNEHKQAVQAKDKKREGKAAAKSEPKLTPAERAAKEKERAEQFARRLCEWKADWLRWLIAEHLRERANIQQMVRVFVLALTQWGRGRLDSTDLGEFAGKAIGYCGDGKNVAAVFALPSLDIDAKAGQLAAKIFYDEEYGPCQSVGGRDLERLCECLEINLEAEWSDRQAGPLSEAYWRLHTKDQLVELAGELKAGFGDDVLHGTKEQLVAAFLTRIPTEEDKEAGLPLPKEVKKAKLR